MLEKLIFLKPSFKLDPDAHLLSTSAYNPEEHSFFYLWSIFADV